MNLKRHQLISGYAEEGVGGGVGGVGGVMSYLIFLQAKPLPGKVAKILTWRWAEAKKSDSKEEDDKPSEEPSTSRRPPRTPKPQREFFVKWHEKSYWHCEWVSELQVCN
jgi:hypothetical protein